VAPDHRCHRTLGAPPTSGPALRHSAATAATNLNINTSTNATAPMAANGMRRRHWLAIISRKPATRPASASWPPATLGRRGLSSCEPRESATEGNRLAGDQMTLCALRFDMDFTKQGHRQTAGTNLVTDVPALSLLLPLHVPPIALPPVAVEHGLPLFKADLMRQIRS
jgi:hypothetical protein